MLVYGDLTWPMDARAELLKLRMAWQRVRRLGPDAARHWALGDLLVTAGMLVQALLDRDFAARGEDEATAEFDAHHALLLALAEAFAGRPVPVSEALASVLAQPLAAVQARLPEGFALYGVYPEQYARAAREAPLAAAHVHVIGLRSVGTTLGAVVAASLPGDARLYTVRPTGHPFAREVRIGPMLERRLLENRREAAYAIVDEGPGLSGSSFHAMLSWLERRGVQAAQVHLFPSHAGGPGPRASEAVRRSHARANRHVSSFDHVVSQGTTEHPGVASWFSDLTPRPSSITELSGGRWRPLLFDDERDYPASHVQQERRKYLLRTADDAWLLRFLGLGPHVPALLRRGQALAARGFVPAVLAVRHGFTLSRWLDGVPVACAQHDRRELVQSLASYLTFLATACQVPPSRAGAAPQALLDMATSNVAELLGPKIAGELGGLRDDLAGLVRRARPTATDNKLDAHEWLVTPCGRIVKTDALDHHLGHDLIGCQDPAWDVAGAKVELGLDEREQEQLLSALRDGAGFRATPRELRFYEVAYLAFRAAHAQLASLSLGEPMAVEAARLSACSRRYLDRLVRLLEVEPARTAG